MYIYFQRPSLHSTVIFISIPKFHPAKRFTFFLVFLTMILPNSDATWIILLFRARCPNW